MFAGRRLVRVAARRLVSIKTLALGRSRMGRRVVAIVHLVAACRGLCLGFLRLLRQLLRRLLTLRSFRLLILVIVWPFPPPRLWPVFLRKSMVFHADPEAFSCYYIADSTSLKKLSNYFESVAKMRRETYVCAPASHLPTSGLASISGTVGFLPYFKANSWSQRSKYFLR